MTTIVDGNLGISYPVTAGGTSATQASSAKILQVVNTSSSTTVSTSSSSDTDTLLTASITPSSSSSKVLVIVSSMLRATAASTNCYIYQKLWRGAITTGTLLVDGFAMVGSYNTDHRAVGSITYLDSPSTTSSTTYRVSINSNFAASVYINSTTTPSSITLLEIAQ